MAKELNNKKMWESIIKNKTGFQNICVLDIVNALNDQGLTVEFDKIASIEPEQTNWTKNYDWNNGTMTIYNLSKEEHLKVVEFLDCLRHPDVPETDFGKKELANSARTCKDSQELTEFEKAFQLICNDLGVSYSCKAALKSDANELLSIARKQIASEIDVDAMVEDNIICDNAVETPTPYRINERAYYRQGIEDTIKKIKGE